MNLLSPRLRMRSPSRKVDWVVEKRGGGVLEEVEASSCVNFEHRHHIASRHHHDIIAPHVTLCHHHATITPRHHYATATSPPRHRHVTTTSPPRHHHVTITPSSRQVTPSLHHHRTTHHYSTCIVPAVASNLSPSDFGSVLSGCPGSHCCHCHKGLVRSISPATGGRIPPNLTTTCSKNRCSLPDRRPCLPAATVDSTHRTISSTHMGDHLPPKQRAPGVTAVLD